MTKIDDNSPLIDSLKKYSVPVKSFVKIAEDFPDCVWHRKSEFDKIQDDLEKYVASEKCDEKTKDTLVKAFNEKKEGLETLILQDEEGELYEIYFKGIDLERISTIGGYKFNEVAAKHVGIYHPFRNKIGYRE